MKSMIVHASSFLIKDAVFEMERLIDDHSKDGWLLIGAVSAAFHCDGRFHLLATMQINTEDLG